jgi:type IX secretion system PorP/SprF family membrane protein
MPIRIRILLFANLLFYTVSAQQMPTFSQYMLNGFVINSAMAGSDGFTSFNLISRQQWMGMENAPRTFSVSAQTRLLMRNYMIKTRLQKGNRYTPARSGRVGLGVNVYSDRNGIFEQSGASFSYAYHISFPNSQLSFGLSGTLAQYKINSEGIKFRTDDPKENQLNEPAYVPDVNIGCYYDYMTFYAGLSCSNIMQSNIKFGNQNINAYKVQRHYFLLAGYKYLEQRHFIYEPTILLKTTESLYPQVDISFKVTYFDNYWLGLSYRSVNTVIAFMGVSWKNFSAGYAFDYGFNAFQRFNVGSHEVNLSLRFGDSAKRYKWIKRY